MGQCKQGGTYDKNDIKVQCYASTYCILINNGPPSDKGKVVPVLM